MWILALFASPDHALPNQAQLQAMTARFAPTQIRTELQKLPKEEQAALAVLDKLAVLRPIFTVE